MRRRCRTGLRAPPSSASTPRRHGAPTRVSPRCRSTPSTSSWRPSTACPTTTTAASSRWGAPAPYDSGRAARVGDRAAVHPGAVLTMAPAEGNRLALLLAMAMFVLVVDTSIMNVSISSVVHDLDTDVSAVQAAIALEALVSA